MLCGLSAAGTDVVEAFLIKGDAAGGHAGLFLHCQLTFEASAPHGLDKAAVLFLQLLASSME